MAPAFMQIGNGKMRAALTPASSFKIWLGILTSILCLAFLTQTFTDFLPSYVSGLGDYEVVSVQIESVTLAPLPTEVADTEPSTEAVENDNTNSYREIPKLIHQTYANEGSLITHNKWAQYVSTWVNKNPAHSRMAWTDDEIRIFLENNNPKLLQTYDSLPLPILKADLWRYIIVNTLGGVYTDMDTSCLRPISLWTADRKNISMIVGLEVDACDRNTGRCVSVVRLISDALFFAYC